MHLATQKTARFCLTWYTKSA